MSEIASPKSIPARPPSAEDTTSVEAKIRSTSIPSSAAARPVSATDRRAAKAVGEAGGRRGWQEGHPMRADQGLGNPRPEHEDRAVSEVEDVEHTEDQRVAHGEEGVDRPNENRVEDLLGQRAFS